MKSGPERELTARYADRFDKLGRSLGFSGPDIIEIAESRSSSATERKNQEAGQLLGKLPDDCFLLALDEHGDDISSPKFARLLAGQRDAGKASFGFAIGGADGHGAPLLNRADQVLSLGSLTWPHQLVRMLLCEQIYRAGTILSGHPYHRV